MDDLLETYKPRLEGHSAMPRLQVTEYLDLDLESELWCCHTCGAELKSAHENYKYGCLVFERDPSSVHPAVIKGEFTFSPDPEWVRILEFYCPRCARQLETEYLPPGHPITHDIEIDIVSLKQRLSTGDLRVQDGRLHLAELQEHTGE